MDYIYNKVFDYGYNKVVELLFNRWRDKWNWGLCHACLYGYKDLAQEMIERGSREKRKLKWNWGLSRACEGGHKELAELMIEKGADDWNWGLANACMSGHKELVELMIENGANDWYTGLNHASYGGHNDLAIMMIERGASIDNCWLVLSNDNIYYLVQKQGRTGFRKNIYDQIAHAFRESQINLPIILNHILNNDLTSLILEF